MDQQLNGRNTAVPEDSTIIFNCAPVCVPMNLGEWIEPGLLAKWVLETVEKEHSVNLEAWDLRGLPVEVRSEYMPTVLLYSYCTGRYLAEAIVDACHSDPWLLHFCNGKYPFANELDQVRHRNRPLLEELLFRLLVLATQERFKIKGTISPGLQRTLMDEAAGRLMAAHQVSVGTAEAEDY